MVNKKRLLGLLQRLISINSENPPGNESGIAGFVRDHLKNLGLETRICAFKKNRGNIIAVLGAGACRKSLLITPHLDTVPAGRNWRYPAFKGTIEKGRIYGLGATDCKGNLAVSLEAINSLVEDRIALDYNLVFAATADEESGSGLGLIPLLNKGLLKADAAIVLDADDFEIIVAQKGLMHLKVKIAGKKAHGAYPWRGTNAIDIAVAILEKIKKYKFTPAGNKYLRPPTLNIGTIHGGDKVNVVADWCEFELDFRFLPGMSQEKILQDTKNIIKSSAAKYKIEIEGIQKPYSIEEDHILVRGLVESMRQNKIRPRIKGSEGATVITFFQDKGIPATATGFGCGACAHISDEYAKTDSLYKGGVVLVDFLRKFSFDTEEKWKK